MPTQPLQHTTITTRKRALLLQYGRATQYITIRTTTKGNSTNKGVVFQSVPFSEIDITFSLLTSI